jgi:hypothetical protein
MARNLARIVLIHALPNIANLANLAACCFYRFIMAAFRARDISALAPSTSWTGARGRGRASLRGSRGGRSDRGGRGGWRQPDGPPIPDLSRNPLGQLLCTVSSSDLQIDGEDFAGTAAIADLKYVSSYNWVNSETPTIIVPGKYESTVSSASETVC